MRPNWGWVWLQLVETESPTMGRIDIPPIESCNLMRAFFATGSLSCRCALCGAWIEWREIAMQVHKAGKQSAYFVACMPCATNRAAQPDCRLEVLPGCQRMYDEWREVQAYMRELAIPSHDWCGDVCCHLCNSDLRGWV